MGAGAGVGARLMLPASERDDVAAGAGEANEKNTAGVADDELVKAMGVTIGEDEDGRMEGMDTTDETMEEEAGVTATAGADVEMGNVATDDAPTVTVTVEKMTAVTVVTPPAGAVEAGAGAAATELMIVTG